MPQAIYTASAESFVGALGSLAAILAPDMFPLSTQVRPICFHAGLIHQTS
jgi:hypothetical protein